MESWPPRRLQQALRISAALLAALTLAHTAGAQEARKYGDVDTATVAAVDLEAARVVIDTVGGAKILEVEPVTRILRGAEAVGLASVNVGDRVVVEAHDDLGASGPRLVADRIALVAEDAGTPSAPTESRPE